MTCRHFGRCGGCPSHHLSYPEQLIEKEKLINTLFGTSTGIVAAPHPWHYRNKMQFSFGYVKGLLTLGLYKKRGEIEDLEECPISPAWFSDTLATVRDWGRAFGLKSYYPRRDRGHLRTLTLRQTSRGRMAILTVSGHPAYALPPEAISALTEKLSSLSFFICTQVIEKKQPTRFLMNHLAGPTALDETFTVVMPNGQPHTFSFSLEPLAFLQPNIPQAEKLYAKALALAAITPSDTVLDLFCGIGTLSHFASLLAAHVTGIEINPAAIHSARENASRNQRSNLTFIEGDASELPEADIVLVDPPRSGLGPKTIAELLRLKPKRIVYISCNPLTQATDCQNLLGYTIEAVQPFDQFPQTPHIENIILLCASP